MDSVYRERAHLVAHLAAVYPAATIGFHDPDEDEWPVIYINTATGQLSWHISPDDMDLFAHVPRGDSATWDGHSTEEKYERLDRLTAHEATLERRIERIDAAALYDAYRDLAAAEARIKQLSGA